jgi:hypothetical protein
MGRSNRCLFDGGFTIVWDNVMPAWQVDLFGVEAFQKSLPSSNDQHTSGRF